MNLNKYIDHTVLKADTPKAKVQQIIDEAIQYDFMSVCINPTRVSFSAEKLAATDVKDCTVIAFPMGANTSTV